MENIHIPAFLLFFNVLINNKQNYACRCKITISKSIIWQLLMHTGLAKQRAPKLNHYYSSAYYKIANINSIVGGMSIKDGTLTNR